MRQPKMSGERWFAHWRLAVFQITPKHVIQEVLGYSVDVAHAILQCNFIFIKMHVKYQVSNNVVQIALLCTWCTNGIPVIES